VPGHGPARSTRPIISTRRRTDCSCYPWTFKPSKALRPLRPGATTNPERWLWTSLCTLKESASSGGQPDFREFPKSIAIRRVNSSRPPPAKSREKPARLGRWVRVLRLVVCSNHLAESVALPPIEGSIMPQSQSLSSAIPFAAIARPACPKCKARMMLASIESARAGVDLLTFECAICNHELKTLVAHEDPMKSRGLGRWLQGDLHPPR
jgi:hypothetical protein